MAYTVVASAYDTSGNGGRKLVKLSNGWLVCAVVNSSTSVLFYKSTDNGSTWSQLCYRNAPVSTSGLAIVSNGTNVYVGWSHPAGCLSYSFDATTVTNTNISTTSFLDTGQTSFGSGLSLAIDGNGYLHATWCSKNSTYPNSFNIRYSKSTDGGTTWATPTQITTTNTTSQNNTTPCIVVKSNNYPVIIWGFGKTSATLSFIIKSIAWNGGGWNSAVNVYDGTTYEQYNPCAVIDGNDIIHTVWQGGDGVEALFNIRQMKSVDGGVTWTKQDGTVGHDKITNGNVTNKQYPSITRDNQNNQYIFYEDNGTLKYIKFTGNSIGSQVTLYAGTNISVMEKSTDTLRWIYKTASNVSFDSLLLLWSHKLMGITPTKIMGMQPSKVMGVQ